MLGASLPNNVPAAAAFLTSGFIDQLGRLAQKRFVYYVDNTQSGGGKMKPSKKIKKLVGKLAVKVATRVAKKVARKFA